MECHTKSANQDNIVFSVKHIRPNNVLWYKTRTRKWLNKYITSTHIPSGKHFIYLLYIIAADVTYII